MVYRWDESSGEDTYECFSMGVTVNGVDCGVVERINCGALRWICKCEKNE